MKRDDRLSSFFITTNNNNNEYHIRDRTISIMILRELL